MRRLPSEPAYLMQKRIKEEGYKRLRRRLVVELSIFGVFIIFITFMCIKNSDFVKSIKYKFNGIDCVIQCVDYDNGIGVFFESEGETALIDSGAKGHSEDLLNFIESKGIEKLNYLLISDPDEEYLSVLSDVIETTEISKIIVSECDDSLFAMYDDFLFGEFVILLNAENTTYFQLGEMKFDILDTETVTTRVTFEDNSFLVYNSCSEETELEIMDLSSYRDFDALISLDGNLPSEKLIETVNQKNVIVNRDAFIKSDGVKFKINFENQ